MGVGTPESATRLLVWNYALAHERVLKVVDDLTDAQFAKPIHPSVHSIGWQLWHTARWDDRFAEILLEKLPELAQEHGAARQLWTKKSFGERWGLTAGALGLRDTGTDMKDEERVKISTEYASRQNAEVEKLQKLADKFNVEVRAFKAKQPPAAAPAPPAK